MQYQYSVCEFFFLVVSLFISYLSDLSPFTDSELPSDKWYNLALLNLEPFQRVYTYLKAYDENQDLNKLENFVSDDTGLVVTAKIDMIEILVKYVFTGCTCQQFYRICVMTFFSFQIT